MENLVRVVVAVILVGCSLSAPSFSDDGIFEIVDIPYEKFVLDNGLRLIVHEDHKAPIVAINIWYHVGSKNEKVGKTGFAHLFEHLMFNGSEHYNDDYFKVLEQAGATDMNGTTSNDRTNYFQNVPTSALDLVLWMESDRMGHLLGVIDQDRLDEQRGVVQNEKRLRQNRPYGMAYELISANTYPKGHPYSWTVIGSMEDLDAATVEDVQEWFNGYYGAANAVLSIVGDVNAEDVRARVEEYFGDIPSGPPVVRYQNWTARRTGTQRQRVEDHVPQARIYKAWNVPGWGSEDMTYLNLLSDIMAVGKTSRLHKRLVYEEQIATDVSAYVNPREIAGQFILMATARAGGDLGAVEKALDEELSAIIKKGPNKQELERVKTQYFANFVRGIERIGGFGGKSDILAQHEVFGGSPDDYKLTLERVRDASTKDIQRAAAAWLSDGVYALEIHPFPKYSEKESTIDRSAVPTPGAPPTAQFPELHRTTLSNGLRVVLAERHAAPIVRVDLIVNAGYAADHLAAPGTAKLTMNMLDEGTQRRSAFEISDELALLGAELLLSSSLDSCTLTLSALKANLDESLDIFADVLLNPLFDAEEFDRQQKQQLAGIDQEMASPQAAALRVYPALIFGDDHPYGSPYSGSGYAETVEGLTANDLKAFHNTWFKPNNATLIVVGDTTLQELLPALEDALGSWKQGDVPTVNIPMVAHRDAAEVFLIDRPGAQQSYIVAAHVAPAMTGETEPAINAVNRIFGGSFTSRINMNLREDKHWSYGVRSHLFSGKTQRAFVITAPVQTDKTKESMSELAKELKGIVGDAPITTAELEKTQNNETLRLPGQWETGRAVARSMRKIEEFGLPEDYYLTYPDRVRALSLDDLEAAAAQVLHPQNMVWLIVGDLEKVEAGIRELELGTVYIVDANGRPVE